MNIYCQNCGAEMDAAARFCEKCGSQVQRSAQNDGKKGGANAPTTHCGKCKRQVPLYGDEKCPYCGAVVHEPTGPLCPKCGTQMQDAARNCVVCGAEIPGEYDKKPAQHFFRLMVYRTPNGLYGISIAGWVVLTALIVAVMGIVFVIEWIAA